LIVLLNISLIGPKGARRLSTADGTFPLRDSDGNTINAKRRLIAQLTIKDGRVWYERPSE
jgi:hypothetical protein